MRVAHLLLVGVAALGLLATIGQAQQTPEQQAGYAIGVDIGRSVAGDLKRGGLTVDMASVAQGIADALAGGELKMTDEQMKQAIAALEKQMRSKRDNVGQTNLQQQKAFLAKNGKNPEVKTTASGLQYKIIQAGTGAMPKATDVVRVHYTGLLLDSTKFDSSIDRGEPAEFPVGGVIPGWTEALQLMKVGAKWRLYIPSDLGYGPNGAGADIGPNALLIFDVQLLGIVEQVDAPGRPGSP